jgi:hypothetical protein
LAELVTNLGSEPVFKTQLPSQVWSETPVIPVIGRLRQKNQGQQVLHSDFEANLGLY